MDVGEEGAYGQPKGVLHLVAEAHAEDVPGSSVGDDLVLDALGVLGLGLVLWLHK